MLSDRYKYSYNEWETEPCPGQRAEAKGTKVLESPENANLVRDLVRVFIPRTLPSTTRGFE